MFALLFCPVVPQVASRQRQREAVAAGQAVDDEGEFEEYDPDDDNLGDGFTRFVARDEDNEAGLLMYEDELDGEGFSESDFLDRDEAEEEGEDVDEGEAGAEDQ